MRKLIVLISVFALSGLAYAGTWQDYKDAKQKAKDAEAAGDTYNAVANYKKAADSAAEFKKTEIQAWQLNNAGHLLIQTFKAAVGYDEKLQKLSGMEPSEEKIAFQKEMADAFTPQMGLLDESKKLLDEATDLKPQESAQKLQSNTDFIAWVTKFVSENSGSAEAKEGTTGEETAAEGNTQEAKQEVKQKKNKAKSEISKEMPVKVTATAAATEGE